MLTLPDLDKVNCTNLQIIHLVVFLLNRQKVCGGERHFFIRHLEIRELVLRLLSGST